MSAGRCGQADDRIITHRSDGFQRHLAPGTAAARQVPQQPADRGTAMALVRIAVIGASECSS
jgi:hypothetical protein